MKRTQLTTAVLALSATAAIAAPQCVPIDTFMGQIESVFGEEYVAGGIVGETQKNQLRIYINTSDLTFTIVVLSEDKKKVCIIAHGSSFHPASKSDVEGEPVPAERFLPKLSV